MKMGRRLRCSSVTYRFRYAPLLLPVRLGPPCRRPILIATKAMLFMGQDTSTTIELPSYKAAPLRDCGVVHARMLAFFAIGSSLPP
jgi:hypothetical protein